MIKRIFGLGRYVNTFHEATAFPEAKTLLAATAEANDRNAKEAALKSYKDEMDHECKKGYIGINALYLPLRVRIARILD